MAHRVNSQCAEQIQRCAISVGEYEKEIQEVKFAAFRHCIPKTNCLLEWSVFDKCYQKSVKAVRSSLAHGHFGADSFEDTAQRYLMAVDQCFSAGDPQAPPIPDIASLILDEDAIYARAIYGLEHADRLWGLPEVTPDGPHLDTSSVCFIRAVGGRIFGNGISRLTDSADPRLNGLNTSCILDESELRCYKRYLDSDQDFQHLVANKDRMLRSCIQSIRLQTECKNNDGSQMRACMCSAREEFENRIQASLVECVRKSGSLIKVTPKPLPSPQSRNSETRFKPQSSAFEASADDASPYTSADLSSPITPGTIINGQCLCACGPRPSIQSSLLYSQPQSSIRRVPTFVARPETRGASTVEAQRDTTWKNVYQYTSQPDQVAYSSSYSPYYYPFWGDKNTGRLQFRGN